MHGQIGGDETDVIPFARAAKGSAPNGADQLDKAGQTILQLLHKAAGVAEENSRHALETAQKLSHQLRRSNCGVRSRSYGVPRPSRARRAMAPSRLHGD